MQPSYNSAVVVTRSARIAAPADRVGCCRILAFDDGGVWTHQLSGMSDEDLRLPYRIVGTPQPMRVPVRDYRAEMQVHADPQQPRDACIVT